MTQLTEPERDFRFPIYSQLRLENEVGEVLLIKPNQRHLKFTYLESRVGYAESAGSVAGQIFVRTGGLNHFLIEPDHCFLWNDHHHMRMNFVFRARLDKKEVKRSLPDGYRQLKWFDAKDIPNHTSIDPFVSLDFGGMMQYSCERFLIQPMRD
ncbi:MAG: hypothetical protein ACYC96_06350 [Fimbriimonadaceae bacterium]